MRYKTILRVFVPNLKLFGTKTAELQVKEVGESAIMLYGKMGWGGIILPIDMDATR